MSIRLVLFSLSFNFSSSAFVLNSFFLRICVYFLPLLLISLSFSGGFLVKEVFLLCFHFLHWVSVCQDVFLIPLVSLDIPCTFGKDGGFIRRDRSFHLPRIDLARAGRCVTDTLSKRFMSVRVSTG